MSKKAFDQIMDGLRDMRAHLEGDETKGKVTTFTVETIDVGEVRAKTELSQEDFAATFGFSLGTIRNWEQKRREPVGPARVLLTLIDRDPALVLKTLRGAPAKRPVSAPADTTIGRARARGHRG